MSNVLSLSVNLPEELIELLNREINQELSEAQRKWKLKLTKEEEEVVRKATFEQLRSKVSTLSKHNWDLGSKLSLNVTGATGALTAPSAELNSSGYSFVLSKSGWAVTQEESDNLVAAENFYENLLKTIFTWTHTAVFYGVGSYNAK